MRKHSLTSLLAVSLSAVGMLAVPASFGQELSLEEARALALETPGAQLESPVGCGKGCSLAHLHAAGWQPGQLAPGARRIGQRGTPPVDPTDVLNNNLSLEVAPPSATITGTNVITVRSNVANLTSFTFVLRWNYTVTNCTITDALGSYSTTPTNANSVTPSYARTITFSRPIPQGQVFTIAISYTGTSANVGLGSLFAGRQYNNTAGKPGVMCSLSQPYYAGAWWPCKDGDVRAVGDNTDRATLDIAITAPDTMQSVSNGVLVGVDTLTGGRKRYRWQSAQQIPTYLVFFSTSTYNQWQQTYTYPGGSMPVHFSVYPDSDTPSNRAAWEQTIQMLATFSSMFGEYPFVSEKYGIYQFEFGGGMEHMTYSGQGNGSSNIASTVAFGESLSAHELGHQWWGDYVTCKTWSDIWLNEGMASYSESLWAERKPGSSGLAALRSAMNSRRPSTWTTSVYVTALDAQNVNRIFSSDTSYRKAGWVMHMLRKLMGDSMYFNFLATYRQTYGNSAASTEEFIALASSVYGSDLSWFFTPWVYGVGAPIYRSSWQQVTIDGQSYVRLKIEQTQATPSPIFRMPIDVQLTSSTGTQTRSVISDASSSDYLLPVSGVVSAVAIDPNEWILTQVRPIASTTYTPGAPKLVSASPGPGASLAWTVPVNSLSLVFTDDMTLPTATIGLSRSLNSGTPVPVPFTLTQPTPSTVVLTFASRLLPGTYDVTVSDALNAGGKALDGELLSNTASALPSGNGQAGGSALWTFTVRPCPADFNQDGSGDVSDIFAFLQAWFAGSPNANVNGDALLNVADIFSYLQTYFAGC